jgi:hypothetical protein
MLLNPFTPSCIVSEPELFFGRQAELQTLAQSLEQGSVLIYGGVGIGKSSLLARLLLHIDGFMPGTRCDCVMAVGNAEIQTVDDAARLVLEELTDVDQQHKSLKLNLKLIEYESEASYSKFVEGRHLAALNRLLEDKAFGSKLRTIDQLVIAIDEADKCPRALARLVRAVSTKIQLAGITNLRFVLAGVSPFYDQMIAEDQGVSRTFYRHVALGHMTEEEGMDLLDTKLLAVQADAAKRGIRLQVDPDIPKMILQLSGLHPHLIQLLGSYMIARECEDPDGILDMSDLVGSLRAICYEARGVVYERLLHTLEAEGKLEAFNRLLALARPGLPTSVACEKAQARIPVDDLEWLRAHGIIVASNGEYGLGDEFLRIRMLLDQEEREDSEFERSLLSETIEDELPLDTDDDFEEDEDIY